MRHYSQAMPIIFSASTYGAVAAKADLSGSLISNGYARIIGLFRSDAAVALGAASGLFIQQSADWGANWETTASYSVAACAASSFDTAVVGNAVKVRLINGDVAASRVRYTFMLRPI